MLSPTIILKRFIVIGCLMCMYGCSHANLDKEKEQKKIEKIQPVKQTCSSAREYITALRYMRSHSEFALPEPKARETALKVSSGCNGAAHRFAVVTSILSKAGLASRDAVNYGILFSSLDNENMTAFVGVFERCYLSEFLDLDLFTCAKMASQLSSEFNGDHKLVLAEFDSLVKFCLDEEKLNLPRPRCGDFAAKLAKQTEGYQKGIYVAFVRAYEFLISTDELNLKSAQALKVAEELVMVSPASVENFIQAYEYAVSKNGLSLGNADAFQFAREIANKTLPTKTSSKDKG